MLLISVNVRPLYVYIRQQRLIGADPICGVITITRLLILYYNLHTAVPTLSNCYPYSNSRLIGLIENLNWVPENNKKYSYMVRCLELKVILTDG